MVMRFGEVTFFHTFFIIQ